MIQKLSKRQKKAEKNYSMTKTRHIPAELSRAGREEGVPAGAAKKREVDKSKKRKKIGKIGKKAQKSGKKLSKERNLSHTC
jgi:hypothetical protein